MWHELWVAFALLLVLEGILPFVNPNAFRQALASLMKVDDRTLRIGGLISMSLGLGLLFLIR